MTQWSNRIGLNALDLIQYSSIKMDWFVNSRSGSFTPDAIEQQPLLDNAFCSCSHNEICATSLLAETSSIDVLFQVCTEAPL